MKLGIGLLVVGLVVMAAAVTIGWFGGSACVPAACADRATLPLMALGIGAAIFVGGYLRCAYTAWRSRDATSRVFVTLLGVIVVVVLFRWLFPDRTLDPARDLPDLG